MENQRIQNVSLREAIELSLVLLCTITIDKGTFKLLYDVISSINLHFPCENYVKLDLDNLCDDESKTEFRFYINGIFQLKEVLRIKLAFIF